MDEGAQRDAIIELNQTISSGIASARLPDNAPGSLPFFLSSNITNFGLTITDVEVRSEDPSVAGRQGALVLHIEADSAFAELDGLCRHVAIRSPVSADLRYQPYVDWAADPGRPQVALALTDIRVNAEAGAITTSGGTVCVPNLGIDIGPSIARRVGQQLHGRTEPLLSDALRVLSDPTNELLRCMFVASSPFEDTSQTDNGFHTCDDGSRESAQTVQAIADALVINKAVCQ